VAWSTTRCASLRKNGDRFLRRARHGQAQQGTQRDSREAWSGGLNHAVSRRTPASLPILPHLPYGAGARKRISQPGPETSQIRLGRGRLSGEELGGRPRVCLHMGASNCTGHSRCAPQWMQNLHIPAVPAGGASSSGARTDMPCRDVLLGPTWPTRPQVILRPNRAGCETEKRGAPPRGGGSRKELYSRADCVTLSYFHPQEDICEIVLR